MLTFEGYNSFGKVVCSTVKKHRRKEVRMNGKLCILAIVAHWKCVQEFINKK